MAAVRAPQRLIKGMPSAQYLADKAARRKESGLCVDCREPPSPAVPGRIYCQAHLDKRSKKRHEIREDRKAKGLCVQCGDKAEPGHVHCDWCLKKHNLATLEHTQRRLEVGLCPRCGQRKPSTGRRYCSLCARKFQRYHRRRYKRQLLAKTQKTNRVAEWRQRFHDNPERFVSRLAALIKGRPKDGTAAD